MITSGALTFPSANSSAFIGSSNITRAALTTGLEWNLRVDQSENVSRFEEICHQFEELFKHKQSIEQEQPASPNDIQVEALAKLEQSREEGNRRLCVFTLPPK